jgi:branched-chain amino acid transport system permease protein
VGTTTAGTPRTTGTDEAPRARPSSRLRRALGRVLRLPQQPLARHALIALLGLLVVVVVLALVGPFRASQVARMGYLAIAVGGLTVLTGLSGQLSLGHGAFMATGAYTAALLLRRDDPPALVLTLLVAVAVTLVVGAVVGLAAARLHGPYIAGATLALALAVPGLTIYFTETLGGEQGLTVPVLSMPTRFGDAVYFVTAVDISQSHYLAYVAWFSLLLTFVLLANLSRSRVGRRWRAVRDDEVAAELAGIHLGRARVSAFVVSAGCAGLAGAVLALVTRITAPSAFTLTLSLALLTAAVLGGLGSLFGALVGAALLAFLPSAITDLGGAMGLSDIQSAELAPLLYGVVLVVIILVAPAGLVGSVRGALAPRVRGRTIRRRSASATSPGGSS